VLTVDLDAPEPLHDQIVRGLREAIARGRVRVGDRLPSVRQLAGDLAVNLNTVARAYRRLEEDGLLRVRHGQGAVVLSAQVARPDRRAAMAALDRALDGAFAQARLHGLAAADLRRAVERAEQRLGAAPEKQETTR
jgi:GntR family transcriptional regulator